MNYIINKKNRLLTFIVVSFFISFLLITKNVSAMELKLESDNKQVTAGDTISVDVLINTEGENINVVEGSIAVSSGLDLIEIKELSTANSALKQWVRMPSWSKQDGVIYFVGGLPGGINQKSVNLFKIFFSAKSVGQATFSPKDIKAFANDGLATQVGVHVAPLVININQKNNLPIKDELQSVVSRDFNAPTGINVDLGQDPSLFSGQKFINISASDLESGVSYFEVKEGNRDPVKTSNSYVLQNQEKLEPIIVFAFDKAGNVSKKTLSPYDSATANKYTAIIYVSIILVFIVLAFVVYRRIKKKIIK